MKYFVAAAAVLLMATMPALPASATESTAVLEEVLVSGVRAGPGLWRVMRDGHVLWVLGTPEMLPRRMTWQSAAVEQVLGEAGVLVLPPSVDVKAGPITMVRLYRQWRRTQIQADRATLRETLDADTYARFEALQRHYLPKDQRIQRLRPMLAADRLFDAALADTGLTDRRVVDQQVTRLAKRGDVPLDRPVLAVQDPGSILDELTAIPKQHELACLRTTIARIETDLPGMVARANAWSLGDMSALRAQASPDQRAACTDAIAQSPRLAALLKRHDAEWLDAAERALAQHRTALALAPIHKLLDPAGLLLQLRARGYTVVEPTAAAP